MVSDPHMVLGMASMIPGLGEIAAAADMALWFALGILETPGVGIRPRL